MNEIIFTRYQSTGPLSKQYWLENDVIQKQAAAQMYSGTAERVTLPFADFPQELAKADAKTALGYGLYPDNYPGKVSIVQKGQEQTRQNSISRTKDYFQYRQGEGVLLIDYDPSEYGPVMTTEQLLIVLIDIHPAIGHAARIVRGSVSAGVHKKDEPPGTGKGFHVYIPVANAADVPRYGAGLFNRLWLAGVGFIALSACGSLLERTVVDGAVFSPERLDFVGRPLIQGNGLTYTPPEITYVEGGLLETETLPDLTADEQTTVARLKAVAKTAIKPKAALKQKHWADSRIATMQATGVPIEKAREIIRQMLKGGCKDLFDDFILEFSTGPVKVSEVLRDPKAYDGKVLSDPIEGREYGLTTAKFYWNNGKPVIHSLAHGQDAKYFLHDKAEGAKERDDATQGEQPPPIGVAKPQARGETTTKTEAIAALLCTITKTDLWDVCISLDWKAA